MKKIIYIAVIFVMCDFAQNAMALLQVTPFNLDYGVVTIGESKTLPVTVTNKEAAAYPNIPVTINDIRISDHYGEKNVLSISSEDCPMVLNVAATCRASVTFRPQSAARTESYLWIHTAEEGDFRVELYGTGVGTQLTFNPTGVAFGNYPVGSTTSVTVLVTNNSDTAVNLTLTGGDDFNMTHNCSTLKARDACTINLVFKPTEADTYYDYVTIIWDGGNYTLNVSGRGTSESQHADDGGGGGCFISTASTSSYSDAPVKILHHPAVTFRTLTLKKVILPTMIIFIMTAAFSFIVVRRL
jgi:hypothetical protein